MGYCLETSVGPFVLYIAPINVKPGRGGMGKGWGFLLATQTFCQNACGLGIEKSSNEVQGPHPRTTK